MVKLLKTTWISLGVAIDRFLDEHVDAKLKGCSAEDFEVMMVELKSWANGTEDCPRYLLPSTRRYRKVSGPTSKQNIL
jgi:hypothetical protein